MVVVVAASQNEFRSAVWAEGLYSAPRCSVAAAEEQRTRGRRAGRLRVEPVRRLSIFVSTV